MSELVPKEQATIRAEWDGNLKLTARQKDNVARIQAYRKGLEAKYPEEPANDKAAIDAMARQGIAAENDQTLSDLRTIGAHTKAAGVSKVQLGRGMLAQNGLHRALTYMLKEMERTANRTRPRQRDRDMMVKQATAIALLAGKLSESQKVSIETEIAVEKGAIVEREQPANLGFLPGQNVVPGGTTILARDVHIHEPERKTEKPVDGSSDKDLASAA